MAFNINGAATAGPKGLFSIDPLDVRLQVKTKAALADIKAGTVYESIHVFCQEDKKFYTPKNYSTTAADANVEWEEVKSNSAWGQISGTLSDQTDLNTELTNIKTDISNLQARGRFLSLWNAVTGLPASNPATDTYEYKTGDYFVVGRVAEVDGLFISQTTGNSLSNLVIDKAIYKAKVNPIVNSVFTYTVISEEGEEKTYSWKLNDTVVNLAEYGITYNGTPAENDVITVIYTATIINYRPDGTIYTKDVASTTVETEELSIDDTYYFDGAVWKLQQNRVKIATTSVAGIVKPDGVSITVATDGTLTATAQESHYRGKWNSWADVPSVDTSYPEDYHGETTPTENDYIVVANTSDFPVTDYNDSFEYSTNGYGHVYIIYQGETLNIPLKNGESFVWNNKVEFTNNNTVCVPKNISGSAMKIDDVVYQNNQNLPRALTQVKAYCITPLQGSWRFAYHGTWDTDNKNGWTPEYQLEDVLPLATEQEAGIAKLYTTTGTNTDGSMDQNSITTALGNKQDTLTAGTGIDITNNTISIVAVEIRDYTSNQ